MCASVKVLQLANKQRQATIILLGYCILWGCLRRSKSKMSYLCSKSASYNRSIYLTLNFLWWGPFLTRGFFCSSTWACAEKKSFFWPKYFTRLHMRGWESDTSFLLIRSQFEIYIYYSYLNNIDKLLISWEAKFLMRNFLLMHEKSSGWFWARMCNYLANEKKNCSLRMSLRGNSKISNDLPAWFHPLRFAPL